MKSINNIILTVTLSVICSIQAFGQNAGFTATSSTQGCSPLLVQFTSSDQSTNNTHSWDFGNGSGWINNAPINPSRVYTAPGTYTVKHKIGNSEVTKTDYITVYAAPTVNFTASSLSGCPPLSVTFNNTSTPGTPGSVSLSWVFGNGATPNTSTASSPTVVYNSGPNNVTLQVTNSKGCVQALTKNAYIDVLPVPDVNFSASQTDFCSAPASVSFTSTLSGSAPGPFNYLWDFGDGSPTSNSQNPSHTYTGPAPAQYTVKLTVSSSNGCSRTITKNAYIKLHKPAAAFTGPATGCLNTLIKFTNTGLTAGANYTWDFGDGSPLVIALDGYHRYTSPGTYTVKLQTAIAGCVSTVTHPITIRPKPNPTIIVTPDSLCPAPQSVTITTNPVMSSYDWLIETPGGLVNYTSTAPNIVYTANGHYDALVRVVDAYGCKDTVSKTNAIIIYPLNLFISANSHRAINPAISDSGCVPHKVNFKSKITRDSGFVYPYGVKTFSWKFGDGNTSTLQNPTHTYTDSGTFMVTLDILTNNGCTNHDTLYVKAGYKPVSDFTATPRVLCVKNSVIFTAHSTGNKPFIYKWFFGDGPPVFALDSVISHTYMCTDSFTVGLQTISNGCISDKEEKSKFIDVQAPCAKFKTKLDCDNRLRVFFENKSIGDSSRIWFFGDGITSTDYSPTHVYAAPGVYNIMLTTHNTTTNCRDTLMGAVEVGPNKVDVSADRTEICTADSINFHAYFLVNPNVIANNFKFYVNNVLMQDSPWPDFKYFFNNRGIYTVKVVSEDNEGCIDSVIKTDWITVGRPQANFVADTTLVCNPYTIKYTDLSTAGPGTNLTWRFWNFGSTATDTQTVWTNTVNKTYTVTGDFDVYLLVSDNLGCRDSIKLQQYTHVLKPVADYGMPNPACVGEAISFSDASTNAVKWEWTFGDGGTNNTTDNPSHVYYNKGSYNTQLIVTDTLGCRDTSAVKVITTVKPTADFNLSDSTSVCPPLIVDFDGSPSIGAVNYEWDFDDGSSKGQKKNHTVVYNAIKDYNVQLIITDNVGCKDTVVKHVQILGYAGAFEYTPMEGCSPLTVDFTSNVKGAIPTVVWDFGDGNTLLGSSTQPKVTYTYNTPGKYLPKMIFNNEMGCNISSDGLDTIIVDDVNADFETGPACEYSIVEFINKSTTVDAPLNKTLWTFHDGSFSAVSNPKRKYGAPDKYHVKLNIANARGCVDSIEKDIVIHTPQEASAGGDTIICLTDGATLMPSGGVSYQWSPGETLSCTNCTNPIATPKKKTVYTVISTDVNGCHDTAQTVVDIKTHVVSTVGEGAEICEGESATLYVTGAQTYMWTPSDRVDDPTSPAPKVSPVEDTRYLVVAYEGSCIPDSNLVKVIVHPKPTVGVKGEKQIVAGTSADLLASGKNIVRFLWSPSNTLSCSDCSDPVASPYKTTTYTVTVFSKYECVDSANATISVLCDESQLFIPNTFTPNGDGVNDVFMVRGSGISTLKAFRVYNRWGELLFERTNVNVNDKANGWDGNYNGVQLPPDVYVYTVEAYCENDELLKLKGDITILR